MKLFKRRNELEILVDKIRKDRKQLQKKGVIKKREHRNSYL